jgi:hypothetical protein
VIVIDRAQGKNEPQSSQSNPEEKRGPSNKDQILPAEFQKRKESRHSLEDHCEKKAV